MFAKYPTQRGNWLLSVPLFNPWRIASFISFEIYQICKLKLLFHPQIEMKFTPNKKGKKLPEPNHLNCLLVFTSLKHFCLSFFRGEFLCVHTKHDVELSGSKRKCSQCWQRHQRFHGCHIFGFWQLAWIPLNVHPPPTCDRLYAIIAIKHRLLWMP